MFTNWLSLATRWDPVKYVCLMDAMNSRGAVDMGPRSRPAPRLPSGGEPGLSLPEMLAAPDLDVLWWSAPIL